MVGTGAYLTLVFVFLNVLVSTIQYCPSISGGSVPWWILYQQKDKPFIHYYVDSTNNENITVHFPEKSDSVLSRVILSIINTESAEYMVYFSDFLNAKNIADIKQIPMRSQWMHGMFATDNSWESGTWLLSNNLLFPPTKDSNLVSPESRQWISSTIGDSGIDLFYVCISADSNKDVQSIFGKILAGNPFIFNQRINENAFMKGYLQDVRPLNSSFSLHASANLFMNCMYATLNETQEHCLFKYSVETGTEITVFTRPRGMIKRSRSFCYNAQSRHLYEFGVLEQTSFDNSGKTSNSMFVLSDNTDSPASGITCFGQDISASTETVAIMICVRLPGLYKDIIESSEVSTWTCPQQKQPSSHTTSTPRPPTTTDNKGFSPSDSAGHLSSNGIPSEKTEDNTHEDAEYDIKEKQFSKFCDSHDCSLPNEDLNIYSKVEKNTQDDPLQKSEKVSKSFDDMATEIQMHETMKMPTKLKKEQKIPKRPSIQLRSSDDETMMNKYLLKTEQAVLGLFCSGCQFCQKAKNEILYLGQKLILSALDIVVVDINNKYLPSYLEVPWTPFIRYKRQGSLPEWIDNVENRYDKMSVMKFLHELVTTDTSNSTMLQTVYNQPTRLRKRSSSIEISEDGCVKHNSSSSPHKSMCPVQKKPYNCYGDVMRLNPKGRRSKTNSNEWDKAKSQVAVKEDYKEILKRLDCYKKVGACHCISPAVIAAIASRESRAGKLLYNTKGYGDHDNAFGIMQCDLRYHNTCKSHEWDSCGHINAMVKDVLISYIKQIQQIHPKWAKERQLQGGVAAYNFGVSNVWTWKNVDVNTTDHDYSNDVMTRAQWLINNYPGIWKK